VMGYLISIWYNSRYSSHSYFGRKLAYKQWTVWDDIDKGQTDNWWNGGHLQR